MHICIIPHTQTDEDFGVDWTSPAADYENDDEVHVRNTMISSDLSVHLMQLIDPLGSCDDYGISFYLQALDIVCSD